MPFNRRKIPVMRIQSFSPVAFAELAQEVVDAVAAGMGGSDGLGSLG